MKYESLKPGLNIRLALVTSAKLRSKTTVCYCFRWENSSIRNPPKGKVAIMMRTVYLSVKLPGMLTGNFFSRELFVHGHGKVYLENIDLVIRKKCESVEANYTVPRKQVHKPVFPILISILLGISTVIVN